MLDQPATIKESPPFWFLNWKRGIALLLILTLSISHLLRDRSGDVLTQLVSLAVEQTGQNQVTLPDEYRLAIAFGDIGSQLLIIV